MANQEIDVLLAGYLMEEQAINGLVLGTKTAEGVQFAGLCNEGLNDAHLQQKLSELLIPLVVDISPLTHSISLNTKVHWVKPVLVVEVEAGDHTQSGVLFHPRLIRFREDKK